MQITYNRNRFECECTFAERHLAKENGMIWDFTEKRWYTRNVQVVTRLRDYLDTKAQVQYKKYFLQYEPWTGPLVYPKHLTPFPFQLEAARFALSRYRSYLGLDPGLGKTIIAAIIHNTLKIPTLYICPPFLVANVKSEMTKWGAKSVEVMPDSTIAKPAIKKAIGEFIRDSEELFGGANLILDEAHRFKNADSLRSRTVYGIAKYFKQVICMSGTPMPNRPIELYPVLSQFAPETIGFMNKMDYARRYCDLKETRFGWDFSGSTNMKELADRIVGPFMTRVRTEDVMSELPEMIEEMVIVGGHMPPKCAELDAKLLKYYSPEDLMKHSLAAQLNASGEALHLATYRKELGLVKLTESLKVINSILEETDESVLIFAIHKEVVATLARELEDYMPLVITGSTTMSERQAHVDNFQCNPKRRVMIGNIQACGTGFTLTKATRVVFVEFAWTPGDNEQAAKRAHRIGQTKPVLVQYLVFKNSVDRAVLETIFKKQRAIAHL